MSVDYSKVIMVGNGWATRNGDGSLNHFDTALEAAGGGSEAEEVAELDEGFLEWLGTLDDRPKVSEAKDAGFDVSGADIKKAWSELDAD